MGVVKRNLKKVIGRATLNASELYTILVEAEAVVNSRPLTYLYADIDDGTALTPSQFLCGRRLTSLPNVRSEHEEDPDFSNVTKNDLNKNVDAHEKLLSSLWKTWKHEYLVNLREYHDTNSKRTQGSGSPKVGDIVLLKDQLPRCQWQLCRIKSLISGRDSNVRAAKVRSPGGHTYNRPLQHLFSLEIQDYSNKDDNNDDERSKVVERKLRSRTAKSDAICKIRTMNSNSGGEDV